MGKPILDPTSSGMPKPYTRRTKGTFQCGKNATGAEQDTLHLPPGMDFEKQHDAMDLKHIASMQPMGPIILGTTNKRG